MKQSPSQHNKRICTMHVTIPKPNLKSFVTSSEYNVQKPVEQITMVLETKLNKIVILKMLSVLLPQLSNMNKYRIQKKKREFYPVNLLKYKIMFLNKMYKHSFLFNILF